MFNSLTGTIAGSDFPLIMIQMGGIEWAVEVSATTFQTSLSNPSRRVRLFVHLYHREDILKLYGFADEAERAAFLQLLSVPGIGPRQALRILSSVAVDALYRLLEEEDVAALVRVPGLGQKTAAKVVLQLRGKLVRAGAGGKAPRGEHAELTRALVEMGFNERAAAVALNTLDAELRAAGLAEASREAELFRRAIVQLSGNG